MHQGIVALARLHDDVAALAAVAAGRAATRHELLPAESEAAVAAVAGFDANFSFINEHRPTNLHAAGGREQKICFHWKPMAKLDSLKKKKPRPEGEAI